MSGDSTAFAAWLRERAKLAGYDLDERGMTSRLAEASGIDSGQMSRAVRGLAVPAIEGQRGLARALNIPVLDVLIASGYLRAEDITEALRAWQVAAEGQDFSQYTAGDDPPADRTAALEQEPDLWGLSKVLGVPTHERETFVAVVETTMAALREQRAKRPAE
jgi:transcriptional regulator with XRE-family HTH domain